eukprot:s2276_g6.t1
MSRFSDCLGSFLLLCEVLGDPEFGPTTVLPPSPSLQDLAHAAETQARASCKALRRAMRPFKTWRVGDPRCLNLGRFHLLNCVVDWQS